MINRASFWIILKQLAKEFWIPLAFATGLIAYRGWGKEDYAYVTEFWVLFTTVSFFFAQWNRVAKQLRTEKGLQSVESSVQQTLTELRATAERLEGYSTGGKGFCWISLPMNFPILRRDFVVHVAGRFPQRNVQVRIVDLDRMADPQTEREAIDENSYSLDLLIPEHVRVVPLKLADGARRLPDRGFNIFFTAPNGSYMQMLRAVLVDGVTRSAIRVERDGERIFDKVDDQYPRGADGEVEWRTHVAQREPFDLPDSMVVIRSSPKED